MYLHISENCTLIGAYFFLRMSAIEIISKNIITKIKKVNTKYPTIKDDY